VGVGGLAWGVTGHVVFVVPCADSAQTRLVAPTDGLPSSTGATALLAAGG